MAGPMDFLNRVFGGGSSPSSTDRPTYDWGIDQPAGAYGPTVPAGLGALGGAAGAAGSGFGWNLPTAQLGIGGLSALGNLWTAMNAQQMAKKQFALTSDIANTNLNSSLKSYNTQLADKARARGVAEGQSGDQVQAYIDANRLSRA